MKSLEGKQILIIISAYPIGTDFFIALSLKTFFSIKVMESIPDQLEYMFVLKNN
jgi:hypothetical protein